MEVPGELNFGWTGSIFFSTTILTTIGYGNFAPEDPRTRVFLSFMSIPAVGIFGYFLGEIAGGFLLCVAYFRVWLQSIWQRGNKMGTDLAHTVGEVGNHGSSAEILRKYDTDGNNSLSVSEMVQPVLDLENQLFSSTGPAAELPLPSSGKAIGYAHPRIEYAHPNGESDRKEAISKEITKLFETAHKNSKSEIDLLEGHQLMEKIGEKRRSMIAGLVKAHRLELAQESVWVIVGMCVMLVVSGSLTFWQLEPDWTLNDAIYFCIITSTRYE
jgi:hypothetical protein